MNVQPIASPLEGEHVIAVAPGLSPEPETRRRRLNFWSGRSLGAEALETEQDHRSGHLAAGARALSTGVVRGLGIGLRTGVPMATPDLTGIEVLVSPGLGLASSGEEVVVARPVRVRLAEVPWVTFTTRSDGQVVPEATSGVRTGATRPVQPAEMPWAAVLVLQAAETTVIGNQKESDPCELDPAADAFSNPLRVECARLRLCVLPREALPATAGNGASAHDATWRNRLAFRLSAMEATRRPRLDGSDASRLEAGVAPWELIGVPLGLVSFEPDPADSTRFRAYLDRAGVVRSGGRPHPRPRPGLVAGAGTPELWRARVQQFVEQLGELPRAEQAQAGSGSGCFAKLPPAGLLPRSALTLLNTDAARAASPERPADRAGTSAFFPRTWVKDAVPVPVDELDSALAASAALAPYDVAVADRVRILVPVAQRDFEPELLVVAEPDARILAELNRLQDVRQDWLARRMAVRGVAAALGRTLSGQPVVFPSLRDDPERSDPSELTRALPEPALGSAAAVRTPFEIQDVLSLTVTVAPPAGGGVAMIDASKSVLVSMFTDVEATPRAIRLVFENDAGGRQAIWWGRDGGNRGWGTEIDGEFRAGPVPVPGRWTQDAIALGASGLVSQSFVRIRFEVLRGRMAVQAGLGPAFAGFAFAPSSTDGWVPIPAAAVAVAPLEDDYAPDYPDGASLADRLDEIDTAYRGGFARAAGQNRRFEDEKLGLSQVLDRLNAEADEADDFVDLNFTQVQTDLYRVRKFVLGETAAQKLLTNPAFATIAEQQTSTASAEKLAEFVTRSKGRALVPLAEVTKAFDVPARTAGVGLATGGGRLATAGGPFGGMAAPAPAFTVRTTPRVVAKPVGIVPVTTGPVVFEGVTTTRETNRRVSEILEGVKVAGKPAAEAIVETKSVPSVLAGFLAIDAGTRAIATQRPELEATLPPRVLTISQRFQEPPSTENLSYARSALSRLVAQLPQLRIRLKGRLVPTLDPKTVTPDGAGVISLLRLQGIDPATGAAINLHPAGAPGPVDQYQQVPADLIKEADEAEVTRIALDLVERKTSILRTIEAAIAERRQLLERAAETLMGLEAAVAAVTARLGSIDSKVGEARHDVQVARALWQEEQERTIRVNGKRDAVVAGVRFFAYVRPRELDPSVRLTPASPLDLAGALPPVPACLRRHDQPPEELSEYLRLFRQAPARWFADIRGRLRELDTPDKCRRLLESAKRNAGRYSDDAAPAEVIGRTRGSVARTYLGRWRGFEQRRAGTAAGLEKDGAPDLSWVEHQRLVSEHASLGDVVEARHGHADLAKQAMAVIEQIRDVATCLHAEFSAVPPALRLAWTERFSEFDAGTALRDLTLLPRWNELDRPSRRRFQEFVNFLFGRVDVADPEAFGLINDLVRITLLLSSHAPVAQLIAGHVPRTTPVSVGGLVLVRPMDPNLVRAGMSVVVWSRDRVVARAKVEDLRGGETAIRVHDIADPKATTHFDASMRVQFVSGAVKATGR